MRRSKSQKARRDRGRLKDGLEGRLGRLVTVMCWAQFGPAEVSIGVSAARCAKRGAKLAQVPVAIGNCGRHDVVEALEVVLTDIYKVRFFRLGFVHTMCTSWTLAAGCKSPRSRLRSV